MMMLRRIGWVTSALLLLAGCAGGGVHAPMLPSTSRSAAPGAGSSASARLTVVVPGARNAASGQRRPQYVSPASVALGVTVNGSRETKYGLTPQSPGCSVALVLTCTFTMMVPAGADTFGFTLYDAQGRALSTNHVAQTLLAGSANPISVTLSGVVASVLVIPSGINTLETTAAQQYDAPGLFPQAIEVEALDADGNAIIGPGAPQVGKAVIAAGGSAASLQPAPGSDPNAYVLVPSGPAAGGQTVTVTTSAQSATLGDGTTFSPVSGSATFTFTPELYVGGTHFVTGFSIASGKQNELYQVAGGVSSIGGLALDPGGKIDVSMSRLGFFRFTSSIVQFSVGPAASGRQLLYGTGDGLFSTAGIAVDANDTLYVANRGNNTVTEYARGSQTPTFTISGSASRIAQPVSVAVDARGDLYVANNGGNTVTEYKPQTATPAVTIAGIRQPTGLALDAKDTLYVASAGSRNIAVYAPGATSPTTTIVDPSLTSPGPLALDAAGNLFAVGSSNAALEFPGATAPATNVFYPQQNATAIVVMP